MQSSSDHNTAPPFTEDDADRRRQSRSKRFAAHYDIRKVNGGWSVPSKTGKRRYLCTMDSCECWDFNRRQRPCIHVYAAQTFADQSGDSGEIGDLDCDIQVPVETADAPGDEDRRMRGIIIAAQGNVQSVSDGWVVPSESGDRTYNCTIDQCECRDYRERHRPCKHVWAVRIASAQDEDACETVTVDDTTTDIIDSIKDRHRGPGITPRMSKDGARDLAQKNEVRHFLDMAWDLAQTIAQTDSSRPGRPSFDLQKIVFGLLHKVFTGKSGRRAYSDLDVAAEILMLGDMPNRPTMTKYMDYKSMTPVLLDLVSASAAPLAPLETSFAVDSTAFGSTIRSETWSEHKWGTNTASSTGGIWTKAHFSTGIVTNAITAAVVTESLSNSGDARQMRELLLTTNKRFKIREVYADRAYLSQGNLELVENLGAVMFVPFSPDNLFKEPVTDGEIVWNKALEFYRDHYSEFIGVYNLRSNVESTNSGVKSLFGAVTRCHKPTARVNETLCKAVCWNITRLIENVYLYGIDPKFELVPHTQ